MAFGLKVITPEGRVRATIEKPEDVSIRDTVKVLEAEHRDCEIIISSLEDPEISHSFEVGDYAIDDREPTPSPEVNTVKVVELIDQRADECFIEETGKYISEHDNNRFYPEDDPVVVGTYPNMSSDKEWHFPESRLRKV